MKTLLANAYFFSSLELSSSLALEGYA